MISKTPKILPQRRRSAEKNRTVNDANTREWEKMHFTLGVNAWLKIDSDRLRARFCAET